MNRRTRAKEKANELLTTLGIRRPPVPVDFIASHRGIRVRFVRLDSELSGMIFFQSVPTIAINSLHHPNRQRFTLAHEIGHYELHWDEIGGEVHVDKKLLAFARDRDSSTGSDRKEIEANSFAAELLVPRSMLIEHLGGQIVDIEDETFIEELARDFQVSAQMMSFRIGDLLGR